MSVFAALAAEIDAAHEDDRVVCWIRTSWLAIAGSPVLLPIAPERLRVHAAADYGSGLVVDPNALERWREIVVHPRDLEALLAEAPADFTAVETRASGARLVWGLPLVA